MLLAELESHLSRPVAPTRRVALGRLTLPVDPAPGFGGILLGGVAARFGPDLTEDFHDEVLQLTHELEHGRRIAQPRLRHRLQVDRVGLQACRHRLVGRGEQLSFQFDTDRGTPAQHVLCAVYAAGTVPAPLRRSVMDTVRRGFAWRGEVDDSLIGHLAGRRKVTGTGPLLDPVAWALQLLDLAGPAGRSLGDASQGGARPGDACQGGPGPSRSDVKRAFREQLRAAHPDHGAEDLGAAQRIAELSEARRILLG